MSESIGGIPSMSPNVNNGIELLIMSQYWLISFNKCTTLMQDVNNRGDWEVGVESMLEIAVLFP